MMCLPTIGAGKMESEGKNLDGDPERMPNLPDQQPNRGKETINNGRNDGLVLLCWMAL